MVSRTMGVLFQKLRKGSIGVSIAPEHIPLLRWPNNHYYNYNHCNHNDDNDRHNMRCSGGYTMALKQLRMAGAWLTLAGVWLIWCIELTNTAI